MPFQKLCIRWLLMSTHFGQYFDMAKLYRKCHICSSLRIYCQQHVHYRISYSIGKGWFFNSFYLLSLFFSHRKLLNKNTQSLKQNDKMTKSLEIVSHKEKWMEPTTIFLDKTKNSVQCFVLGFMISNWVKWH